MKLSRWIFTFFCLAMFHPLAGAREGDPGAIFKQANAAYREGNYSEAASLYESLVRQGWKKPSVFYNLGNAYFKEKRLGLALLNYERAKRLNPRNRDISANLSFARGQVEYRIEDKRNWYFKKGEAVLAFFTSQEWGIVSLALSALFLMSWVFSLYFRPADTWGWKRKTVLGLALFMGSIWMLKGIHEGTVREALALKSQAAVRYGPSHKDQVAFRLGEGIKVRLKKTTGEWSQVTLPNGETGWMFHEELGVI